MFRRSVVATIQFHLVICFFVCKFCIRYNFDSAHYFHDIAQTDWHCTKRNSPRWIIHNFSFLLFSSLRKIICAYRINGIVPFFLFTLIEFVIWHFSFTCTHILLLFFCHSLLIDNNQNKHIHTQHKSLIYGRIF